jgi:hypothetical protein
MSDSTFSPAPTPFQGAFSPWAHWHTQRIFGRGPGGGGGIGGIGGGGAGGAGGMGGGFGGGVGGFGGGDAMSMQSSPSHEPVPLPKVGGGGGARKAGGGQQGGQQGGQGGRGPVRGGSKLRREARSHSVSPTRKPPPRVESTQPRDTSPEPSSSGEETAGEESYATPPGHYVPVNGGYDERLGGAAAVMPIGGEEDDDEADWVDEDEEVDPEDLLELEYHPTYVRMAEKRRRRWEIGWEALTQTVSRGCCCCFL